MHFTFTLCSLFDGCPLTDSVYSEKRMNLGRDDFWFRLRLHDNSVFVRGDKACTKIESSFVVDFTNKCKHSVTMLPMLK